MSFYPDAQDDLGYGARLVDSQVFSREFPRTVVDECVVYEPRTVYDEEQYEVQTFEVPRTVIETEVEEVPVTVIEEQEVEELVRRVRVVPRTVMVEEEYDDVEVSVVETPRTEYELHEVDVERTVYELQERTVPLGVETTDYLVDSSTVSRRVGGGYQYRSRARSPTSRLLSSGDLTSRYHLSPRHDVDVVRAAPRRSMLRTGAYLDDDEYYGEYSPRASRRSPRRRRSLSLSDFVNDDGSLTSRSRRRSPRARDTSMGLDRSSYGLSRAR